MDRLREQGLKVMKTNSRRQTDTNHAKAVLVDGVETPTTNKEAHDVKHLSVQDVSKPVTGDFSARFGEVRELIHELTKDDVH